jgi:hypothetical protein
MPGTSAAAPDGLPEVDEVRGRRPGLDEVVLLAPGLVLVGVLAFWAFSDGGFTPTTWYPSAIFLLGLLVVTSVSAPTTGWQRRLLLPAGLLGALCVWSFASISWAAVKGDAWDGANRTLLYLVIFVVAARWPWGRVGGVVILACLSTSFAAIGCVTLVRISQATDVTRYLAGGRLADPTGYPAATAALFLMVLWPAVVLASQRDVPAPLRALQHGVATALLELSILPQSRGALYTLPFVLLTFLVIVPNRARALAALIPIALATAIALPTLLDVYRTQQHNGDVQGAFRSALIAIVASAAAVAAVGFLAAHLDLRWRRSARTSQRLRWAMALALILVAAGGAAAFAPRVGDPVDRASSAWRSFKHGGEPTGGASHFTGLGSFRYDFYRVSYTLFKEHPIGGVGVDNFAADYLRLRHGNEQPKYPHSLELRLLSGTGAVGALLFAGFLVATARVLWRRPIRPLERALSAASGAVFLSWFIHGSVDWLWEFPALGGTAFACLGLAVSLTSRRAPAAAGGSRSGRAARTVGMALAAGLALLSFGLPWLAYRDTAVAAAGWSVDPAAAYARLDTAARLNPVSDQPDLVAGAIASRLGDAARMTTYFERALRRNPQGWYPNLELGTVAAARSMPKRAVQYLRRAHELNPRDPLVTRALTSARNGHPLSIHDIDHELVVRNRRS